MADWSLTSRPLSLLLKSSLPSTLRYVPSLIACWIGTRRVQATDQTVGAVHPPATMARERTPRWKSTALLTGQKKCRAHHSSRSTACCPTSTLAQRSAEFGMPGLSLTGLEGSGSAATKAWAAEYGRKACAQRRLSRPDHHSGTDAMGDGSRRSSRHSAWPRRRPRRDRRDDRLPRLRQSELRERSHDPRRTAAGGV